MWDYSFAIPSMFVITIILVFYFSLPRLSIRMNNTFVFILLIESAVIFSDIVSSWGDENYEQMTTSVLYVLNGLYFICFFIRAYILFMFTAYVFKLDPNKNIIRLVLFRLPVIFALIITISSPWTHLIFSIDNNGYHSGSMYNLIYVVSYFYVLMSFYVMIAYRNIGLKRRNIYCMYLYNLIILIGLIVRKMLPSLLLMDTFCLMAILTVYLAFMNPEFYLELRGQAFNITAFRDYIDEQNYHLNHRVIGLVVHNYYEMRDIYGGRQVDKGIAVITRYLAETFTDCNIFYYRKGRFFILGNSNIPVDEYIAEIKKKFRQPWTADDLELYFEPGFATVRLDKKVDSSDSLLHSLVVALAKADKQNDGVVVEISDSDLMADNNERNIKILLEKVVDEDKVEVFLQPIIDVKTGSIVGAEALSRIRDNEGRILPPGLFIPIAERNGRINALGEQVFAKTCQFIKDHDIEKMGISWINVNLSPVQFMKADLAERYGAIIDKYGIDSSKIHLEITEESMIDDGFLRRQVQAMKGKGFMFVLDDYGTGYSNLARLKNCPFINVKLDMSLVWDYIKSPDKILPSMIEAFRHMGFSITAEGIEDETMAATMTDIGCDYLQGFHFSKPLPIDEFVVKYGG